MALFGKKEPWRPHRIEEEEAQPKRLFQKKRNPKYFLTCKPADVIDLFQELIAIAQPSSTLEFSYQGWIHRTGMECDMDKHGHAKNISLFLDDQIFSSLQTFSKGASLHGSCFAELTDNISILEELEIGDPHVFPLLKERELHESYDF